MGFYTEDEEKDRQNYIPILRNRIIEHLNDLKDKIENNEPLPHGDQDIDLLCDIETRIDECLNNWYY